MLRASFVPLRAVRSIHKNQRRSFHYRTPLHSISQTLHIPLPTLRPYCTVPLTPSQEHGPNLGWLQVLDRTPAHAIGKAKPKTATAPTGRAIVCSAWPAESPASGHTAAEAAHPIFLALHFKVVASLLPRLTIVAALRVPLRSKKILRLRSAAVSCPLAPQARQASISVPRHLRALRSSFSSPLGGRHPSSQFKGRSSCPL